MGLKRRAAVTEMPLRRDAAYANDFAGDYSEPEFAPQSRRQSLRVNLRGGLVPRTLWGKVAAAAGVLLVAGAAIGGAMWIRSFMFHEEHFIVPSSSSIQISGNSQLTHAQLLSIFGEDVDRNVFTIPLDARRAELESLPWVAHATVMRLLPNRVRVVVVERTPVAFVRQGNQIGLVDASGALFEVPGPETGEANAVPGSDTEHYSFPVLTGIFPDDPLSTRAARMKIYTEFMTALDSGGEGISHQVSEVNISDPEDVQAIIPDANSGNADILIHFGQEKYLERYHQYRAHLAEWRGLYPKLASVDMRYEQQVVLQMQKDAAIPVNQPPGSNAATATSSAVPAKSSAAVKRAHAAQANRPRSIIKGKATPHAQAKFRPAAHSQTQAVSY